MIIIIIIALCLAAFFLWMAWEVEHAQELPPDFDYDQELDRILKENENHNNPASM